jgi:hypothetical protein
MREIADWLAEIGLAKYQTVFADNEIDWSLLPKLTEADLKELGLPLGPRKKLLEAVANLTAMPTSADAVPSTPRKIEPVRPLQSDYGSSVNEMHTQGSTRARQSPLYKAVMEIPDLFTVGPMFQRAASPDCD